MAGVFRHPRFPRPKRPSLRWLATKAATAVASSDTGHGTEANPLVSPLFGEAGTGSDSVVLVTVSLADTATGADAGIPGPTSSDTGHGTEAWSFVQSASDSGHGTEAEVYVRVFLSVTSPTFATTYPYASAAKTSAYWSRAATSANPTRATTTTYRSASQISKRSPF